MEIGDIFYSVMQKDNNPFEKPRITKFEFNGYIKRDNQQYLCSTKTDRWGRYYIFKENQIYSTYKDAIPEKNEKLEKIRQWEKDVQEMNKKHFEEQERKEKQRQLDHDKQVRKEVCEEIREIADIDDWEEINGYTLGKILDQIERGEDAR